MKKKLKGARDILMNLYGNSNKLLISKGFGDNDSEFIESVKTKYKRKFGTRSFYIRPVYPSTRYRVQ